MTGLGNVLARDAWVVSHADRPGTAVTLNFANMRFFNGTFGITVGDMLLVRLGMALQAAAPSNAAVYRISGGDFLAVCLGDDDGSARDLADRLLSAALSVPVPATWTSHVACGVATGKIDKLLVTASERAMWRHREHLPTLLHP